MEIRAAIARHDACPITAAHSRRQAWRGDRQGHGGEGGARVYGDTPMLELDIPGFGPVRVRHLTGRELSAIPRAAEQAGWRWVEHGGDGVSVLEFSMAVRRERIAA